MEHGPDTGVAHTDRKRNRLNAVLRDQLRNHAGGVPEREVNGGKGSLFHVHPSFTESISDSLVRYVRRRIRPGFQNGLLEAWLDSRSMNGLLTDSHSTP